MLAPATLRIPSDTGIPGLSRRRVWTAPEVVSHAVVVLTLPRLYLAPAGGAPAKPDAVAALETARDIELVLGPFATTIDLADVTRVRHELTTNTLKIEYRPRNGGTLRTAVRFATPEAADAVFAKLWRRLGDDFSLTQQQTDTWAAVKEPALILAGVLMSTIAGAVGLNALADAGRAPDWLPGWQAVCGVGGAAAAAVTVWLHRRLTRPPERLELARTSG
jgi:hypothetical protein